MNRSVRNRREADGCFLAQLLMPVIDSAVADPELARLEAEARRAAKKRASDAWERGMCHFRLAQAEHDV